MDGILNIKKPRGITSFDVVARVRRLTGEKRVGHAGTLDPEATGVLPVCLGKGTRIVEFLVDTTKTYRAQIELGVATDTGDASGKIIRQEDPSKISRGRLESELTSFCGTIEQVPPMYSAVKYQGRRLYQLARAGIEIERKSRPVIVHSIKLTDWQLPVATVEVICGKGTYIRSLACDLGKALGCGATLNSLSRLRCGIFDIKDAVSLDRLETACRHGYWQSLVYPIDNVLIDWDAVIVDNEASQLIRNGCPVAFRRGYGDNKEGCSYRSHCRAYTLDGCFLGVLRFNLERDEWQPEKVFA
ncbi:MAG: tRNA pseudouridine(55) synthase TruB [Dehalococcoidales bacterium]|nr:tRNA pseudouridine(55) synthase TruB [Dehalococcoidales bacterium]